VTIHSSGTPTAPSYRPQFLVVAHDDASVDRLPAAAAQACRINGRLLVAVARPRGGFTTDAAIARFAARRTDDALLRREREVQRLLGGSGVDWATVRMPFRDSTSVTRRARRLATAAKRLARRRGVATLPAVLQAAPGPEPSGDQPLARSSAAARLPARHLV